MANYTFAREAVLGGAKAARIAWGGCKVIRRATDADIEFINYRPDGLIVQECRKPKCDCSISIYQQTEEDQMADDWKVAYVHGRAMKIVGH